MIAVRRVTAGLVIAATLALTQSACSDSGPTRADIAAKIHTDPRTADSPPAVIDCLADWYMTSTSREERKRFIDNEPGDAPAPRPPDEIMFDCLKKAA
jgi:hypothetical protein